MLRVMVMEAWPSISETTFTLTHSLRSRVAQVRRIEHGASFVGEDEVPILPEPCQAHPFFELAFAVIVQGSNRALGKAHPPPFAGLGARTNYEAAPVLPAGERSPYVQGRFIGVEVCVFPG